jgi:cyclopropane-fatty-acyl-phospholipid synthase
MTYSCGVFETPDATMEEASVAKLDRICRKLGLGPGDHVLEIGTGWGGFARRAARHTGCRVTTTTISERQYEYATKLIQGDGLADRVTILDKDYRDLTGSFDHIVSIEMIEAIGAEQYDTFFRLCSDRLRPGGRMVLQAITIRDELFDAARLTVDFIRRYIFPGSCIPSVGAMRESISRVTDLEIDEIDDITEHYPPTLRAWRDALRHHADAAHELGYDDAFLRMWDFYFCYCEGGFAERRIGDIQMTLRKPEGGRA